MMKKIVGTGEGCGKENTLTEKDTSASDFLSPAENYEILEKKASQFRIR